MRDISFLVNVEHPEIRVAEVREGRLFDLDVERDGRLLGDIYYGQVENIIPGMDAAFVDIGTGRNALIYVGDVDTSPGASEKTATLSIEKLLKSGQEILVQVARPPVGTKGARVTARLSLPGRYTVLMASSDTVGVSRRIESAEERERLRRIVEKVRPLDHGVIVRTEAEGVSAEALGEDIQFLWKQLQHLKTRAAAVRAPAMLHRDLGVLGRLARDRMGENIDRVVIDGPEEYQAFRTLVEMIAPQYVDRIHLHTGPSPIFDLFGVAKDIAQAVDRTIHLPHGGSLVIDEAEALTAIDVNTGKFIGKNRLADTVLKTNLEAADEVARQLRLRNIGGVIVIDFIDMERTRDRVKVMNALEAALKADRTRTRIVQLSPLGLVEMTRRREGDSLRDLLHRPCPYCSGDGMIKTTQSIAIDARRSVRNAASKPSEAGTAPGALQVTLHPEVATAFLGPDGEAIRAIEEATGSQIFLKVDYALHVESVSIEHGSTEDFEATRRELALGQRLYLPPAASLPVSPNAPKAESASGGSTTEFAVLHGILTQLERREGMENTKRPAVIEVTHTGRWFYRARVITSVDPRDE